jgi:hypothetical protein
MSKSKATSESSQEEATLDKVYRSIDEHKSKQEKKQKLMLVLVHVALEFPMVRVNLVDVEVLRISGVKLELLQTPSHPRVLG